MIAEVELKAALSLQRNELYLVLFCLKLMVSFYNEWFLSHADEITAHSIATLLLSRMVGWLTEDHDLNI